MVFPSERSRSAESLEIGQRLGPFRVLDALGSGAVGQVYRVEDELGRHLALKLFSAPIEGASLERFTREAEVTARLKHPGIVTVHASGLLDGRPYILYALVEGEDLEQAFPRLSRERLLQVTAEVADALGYAHAQGVVHRDLKPANVLVDSAGRAHVADFGMAQAVGLERLTVSGAQVGTPHYMAPEQVTGERALYGPPTDVWALGVLLYRALSGRHPFDGQTLAELVARIVHAQPKSLRAHDPSLPPALEAVCVRALRTQPAARYPDGASFAADLRRALRGEPLEQPALQSRGRRRGLLGAAALAALALGALGASAYALASDRTPPGPRPARDRLAELSTPEARVREVASEIELELSRGRGDPVRRARALVQAVPLAAAGLRARLVRFALEPAPTPERMFPTLELLTELGEALPAAPEDPLEAALGNAAFGLAVEDALHDSSSADPEQRASRRRATLRLLERCAGSGLRATDRRSLQFVDWLCSMNRLGALTAQDYWSFVLACVRLDLPCSKNLFSAHAGFSPATRRPWGSDPSNPWARYVEDRIALWADPAVAYPRVLRRLSADYRALLGPVQWSQAVACCADGLAPERYEALLTLAVERAPHLPEARVALAGALLDLGRPDAALEHLARAGASFVELGYPNLQNSAGLKLRLDAREVKALAVLDRRAEARARHAELELRSPKTALVLAREHPWLQD